MGQSLIEGGRTTPHSTINSEEGVGLAVRGAGVGAR
jgi:hypothetical protein